ncbi:MAG: hypothetical protein ACYSX0_09510 [Planctomycetota bacterium]|jgi:hypothetical protein
MQRLVTVVFVLVAVAGCSSSGGGGKSSTQQAFEECASSAVFDLLRVANQLADLLRHAQGLPNSGNVQMDLSPDMGDPPNTYTYSIPFDVSGDGQADTTVSGKITYPNDPSSGLSIGSRSDATFTLTPSGSMPGPLSGAGQMSVTIQDQSSVGLTGSANLSHDGCGGNLAATSGDPLLIGYADPITADTGAQLAAVVLAITVSGTLQGSLTTGGKTLEGGLLIEQGSQNATLGGLIDGSDQVTWTFPIFPTQQQITDLVDCLRKQFALYGAISTIFRAVTVAIENDGGLSAGLNIPGLTIEGTGNPSVFNYEIELSRFSGDITSGTLSGQVRTTLTSGNQTYLYSWRLSGQSTTLGSISGQGSRFFEVMIDSVSTLWVNGAASQSLTGCLGGFDVPSTDPINGDNESGTIELTSSIGANSLVGTFSVSFLASSARVTINGIPIPQDAISIFP